MSHPLFVLAALVTLSACARMPEGLKGLDAPTFKAALETEKAVLLDVRTVAEHAEARIKAPQVHLPVQELEARLAELKAPKDQPILVYCRSGNRSAKAGAILLKAGYRDVRHLEGGIGAWKAKGFPVEP